MVGADEILEALDLSRAEPGVGFLEALFARFNARVPFENASKIVRNAEVADASAKPRTPDVFWMEHLESGAGGTCFARVAAFQALLTELGFRSRRVLGRVERDDDHAALLVETAAGESIVDVGFPLPAIVPARGGAAATSQGELEIEKTPRGFRVVFREGVPETPRQLEIFEAAVPDERYAALWRETFRPDAPFLRDVTLRRDLGNRVLSYAAGEVRVDDLHSRLRVPLAAPRDKALSELFGVDAELLARAFAVAAGAVAPASPDATLTAYLETDVPADRAFSAIATRGGYRRLVGGVADVVSETDIAGGFRLELAAPSAGGEGPSIAEDVAPDAAARRVGVVRRQGDAAASSAYGVLEKSGRTYLVREAALAGRRDDLLRNDSLRGRLAGALAVDLLAWTRML